MLLFEFEGSIRYDDFWNITIKWNLFGGPNKIDRTTQKLYLSFDYGETRHPKHCTMPVEEPKLNVFL